MERRRPYTIGIAGRSCSGKTSISRRLAGMLPGEVTIYGLDHYYLDLSHLTYEERSQMNFDHPDSLESGLLVEHVAALSRGEEIRHPVYDFTTHTRISGKYETVTAGDYLIVEGLFTFYWPELREIFDSRIFIATVDPICFRRRKQRDVAERGRSPESIVAQYNKTVRPGNEAFIVPTAVYADLVVNGEQPIEESSQQIFEFVTRCMSAKSRTND